MPRTRAPLPPAVATRNRICRARRGYGLMLLFVTTSACGSRPTPVQWAGSSSQLPEENEGGAMADAPTGAPATSLCLPHLPEATREHLFEPGLLDSLVAATDHPQNSLGHEPPNYLVQVFVSPEAAAAYRSWAPGSTMPNGTRLVARHSQRNCVERAGAHSAVPAPLYTMYRGSDGWVFALANEKGLKIQATEWACQECHTQARADSVFGPSTPLDPSVPRAAPAKSVESRWCAESLCRRSLNMQRPDGL